MYMILYNNYNFELLRSLQISSHPKQESKAKRQNDTKIFGTLELRSLGEVLEKSSHQMS